MLVFRNAQFDQLAEGRRKAAMASQLAALREKGYKAELDPKSGDFAIEDPAGGTARFRIQESRVIVTSGENRSTLYDYDRFGRLQSVRDPGGLQVDFEHDSAGRLTKISRGTHSQYRFEYDEGGNVCAIYRPDNAKTQFDRGPGGRTRKIVYPDGGQFVRDYDAQGLEVSFTDANGNVVRSEYPTGDGPTTVRYPEAIRHDVVYHDVGDLKALSVNGRQHVEFEFDDAAAFFARYPAGGDVKFAFDGERITQAANEECTVTLQYDDAGRLVAEVVDGDVVRYLRDAIGNLVGLVPPHGEKVTFLRDKEHRISQVLDWSGASYRLTYAPSGALAGIAFPNGVSHSIATSPLGLPESLRIGHPDSSRPFVNCNWEYDLCDRVIHESAGRDACANTYDSCGRLIGQESLRGGESTHFVWDGNGNLLDDGTTSYSVNGLNQVVSGGDHRFEYDDMGNMTRGPSPNGPARFRYNGRGQLIAARIGSVEVQYTYDPFGRRRSKTVGDTTTCYVWAGKQLIGEIATSGSRVTRRDYLHLPDAHVSLAMRENGSIYCLHAGRRAEPLCMTDERGHVVWQARYSAFGAAVCSSDEVFQPWRLAGQYFDEETGLHYVTARYYNPQLARWLTPDPLRVEGGSFNFYSYCNGDPINYVDPDGEFPFLVPILIGAAIGAVVAAGFEAYSQKVARDAARESGQPVPDYDWGTIGKRALIGGAVGAIGGGVGAAVGAGAAATGLGIVGAGAATGFVTSVVEQCAEAGLTGNPPTPQNFVKNVAIDTVLGAFTAGVGGKIARRLRFKPTKGSVGDANFAQRKINKRGDFSPEGQAKYSDLAGRPINTVDDLADAVRKGDVSPSQVPVDYVVVDGQKVVLNTRTSTALNRAGVPQSQWYGRNVTGQSVPGMPGTTYDDLAAAQTARNKLPPTGTSDAPK